MSITFFNFDTHHLLKIAPKQNKEGTFKGKIYFSEWTQTFKFVVLNPKHIYQGQVWHYNVIEWHPMSSDVKIWHQMQWVTFISFWNQNENSECLSIFWTRSEIFWMKKFLPICLIFMIFKTQHLTVCASLGRNIIHQW